MSLRLIDVVLPTGEPRSTITIARGLLKGGRGHRRTALRARTVPMTRSVADALRRHLATRPPRPLSSREPLFASRIRGRPLSRWQARHILQRVLRAAGVPADGRCRGMHSLRKHFARAVYEASGKDLRLTQHALHHRYSSTTEAYLEITDEETAAVIASLG